MLSGSMDALNQAKRRSPFTSTPKKRLISFTWALKLKLKSSVQIALLEQAPGHSSHLDRLSHKMADPQAPIITRPRLRRARRRLQPGELWLRATAHPRRCRPQLPRRQQDQRPRRPSCPWQRRSGGSCRRPQRRRIKRRRRRHRRHRRRRRRRSSSRGGKRPTEGGRIPPQLRAPCFRKLEVPVPPRARRRPGGASRRRRAPPPGRVTTSHTWSC